MLQSSSERVWIERPERNGTDAEWNGSTSPRKEFGAVRPVAAGDNNWRSREAMKERERAENKEEEERRIPVNKSPGSPTTKGHISLSTFRILSSLHTANVNNPARGDTTLRRSTQRDKLLSL